MKLFYQKRAGVSFCGNDPVSIRFDKKYVEYVMKIDGGWHGFVNMVPIPDGVLLFTYWGNFFKRLPEEIDGLALKQNECPILEQLLDNAHPDFHVIGTKKLEADEEMVVLGSPIKCDTDRYYIEMAGDPKVLKRAQETLSFSLQLLEELHKSARSNPKIMSMLTSNH